MLFGTLRLGRGDGDGDGKEGPPRWQWPNPMQTSLSMTATVLEPTQSLPVELAQRQMDGAIVCKRPTSYAIRANQSPVQPMDLEKDSSLRPGRTRSQSQASQAAEEKRRATLERDLQNLDKRRRAAKKSEQTLEEEASAINNEIRGR